MESIRAVDPNDVIVRYSVESAGISTPFNIGIYRSSQFLQYVPNPVETIPIGNYTVSGQNDLKGNNNQAPGDHEVLVHLTFGLAIDAFHKYVLAVPNAEAPIAEVDPTPVSFRIITIGAVAEGLTPGLPFTFLKPGWLKTMASALKSIDRYDYAIPFSWHSATPGIKADGAGRSLANQIEALISQLALQPNDVIDIHLIAHCRGCVVIGQAMDALLNAGLGNLDAGYTKLTFLDPHPANLSYGLNASIPRLNFIVKAFYKAFEKHTRDGPVIVPAGVSEAEDYYQQTSHSLLTGKERLGINLWGLPPRLIRNFSKRTIRSYNLTGVFLPEHRSRIGHGEITDWYQYWIVNTGGVIF
jgi:hypothetical protein